MRSEHPLQTRTGGRAATTGVIPGDVALSVGNPKTDLPAGWKWCRLTDVARLETGHTPSRRHPEWWGGSVPWIGIRDATGNHGGTIYKTEQYTNELGIRNSSARVLPAETVCLSRTASVGYVVVMGIPMATSQDFVNWVCGQELDPRYLKYVLLAERRALLRFASGTTHQTIYFPEVKAFHIAMPPLNGQQGIAEVLGALDNRIAVLRESNATLEGIAQALFKSWFIDFDPVRAKQQGLRPAGMDEGTAALFPNSFDESALGSIPTAWQVGSILDVAQLLSGGTPKTDRPEYWGGDIAWASAKDVSQSTDLFLIKTERTITPIGVEKSATRVIPKLATVVVARGATTGRMAILGTSMAINQTCYALTSRFDTPFVLNCLLRREIDALVSAAHGSVFDTITTDTFARSKVVVPNQRLLQRFEELVGPLFSRMVIASEATQTLTSIRDALLPRLISGQLRVPDSEEFTC